jgi:pimeloyl-[acyl-carrier protein] methyl ester esterase
MSFNFVLVRGLIREAAHWGDFLSEMKKAFPNSQIECIDIPGAGVYYQTPTPTSIDGIVNFMRGEFQKISFDKSKPTILVAISLGGMIAARWLKLYPDDFANAVLINTSYADYSPVWKRLRPWAFKALLKVPAMKGQAKEYSILEVVSNRPENYEKTSKEWAEIASRRPVSVANTFRQLFAASKFSSEGFQPNIPILFLASTNDRMVDVECSRKIAQAWKKPIIEHPEAGHDLSTDNPEWIAQEINRWISGLESVD